MFYKHHSSFLEFHPRFIGAPDITRKGDLLDKVGHDSFSCGAVHL